MNISINSRPWQPGAWITTTGIVLTPKHVDAVCTLMQKLAAETATAAIKRMMQP